MSVISRIGSRLGLVASVALLAACGSLVSSVRPLNTEYCDTFLIYDMCARDTNRDGIVEVVYFTDTREVFMYHPESEGKYPSDLGLHRCAMPMDEEVGDHQRVFYVDDSTTSGKAGHQGNLDAQICGLYAGDHGLQPARGTGADNWPIDTPGAYDSEDSAALLLLIHTV